MSTARLVVCGFLLAGLGIGAAGADDGLLRYEGRDFGPQHASPRLRTLLYDLDLDYYKQRQRLVDELLYEIYLKTEAERRGTTTGELADELLRIEPPDEPTQGTRPSDAPCPWETRRCSSGRHWR